MFPYIIKSAIYIHPILLFYFQFSTYKIGTINPKEIPPSYYSWSSPFYNTLRERVVQRLESLNKPLRGTFQIQFKSVLLLVGFWYSLYQMYTSPFRSALIWTVVMGVFAHFIGTCIQHDGNHGAYSVNKYLNVFAGWTMDMIGASAFTWQFQVRMSRSFGSILWYISFGIYVSISFDFQKKKGLSEQTVFVSYFHHNNNHSTCLDIIHTPIFSRNPHMNQTLLNLIQMYFHHIP